MFTLRLKQFLGPWLAYAALSGLASALGIGVCAPFFGYRSLEDFTQTLLVFVACGFAGGFFTGLTCSLIGGKAGYWWSISSAIGIALLFPATSLYIVPLFVISTFGALLPNWLLNQSEVPTWLLPTCRWLQNSWLKAPVSSARVAGIFLPLLVGVGADIIAVAPVYATHKNYATRWGFWRTWQKSSRGLVRWTTRKGSCQANLKQIMLGVRQYIQDYDEVYPAKPTRPEGGVAAVTQPYLKSALIFQCPSEFYHPEDDTRPGTLNFKSGDFNDYWFNGRFYGLNEAEVEDVSSSVMWGDGNTGSGEGTAAYSLSSIPDNFGPAKRHRDGANYAFADGHVKWLPSGKVSNTAAPSQGIPSMRP